MIISSGITRVVVGTTDTSKKISGSGIAKMRMAGIEVLTGVLETECREINKRFFTWHEKGRPYVILKWARSEDGYIDHERRPGEPPGPRWITGLPERALVHKWRSEEDAIVAGGATVRIDDPALNVRLWAGKDPLKVIVSKSGHIMPDAKIFSSFAPTVLFTRNDHISLPGAQVVVLREGESTIDTMLKTLYNRDILSIFVEGGASLIREFIDSGLWDEARRFTGRMCFGNGVPDPYPDMKPLKKLEFEMSTLEIGTRNFN